MEIKVCKKCEKPLPATKDYFYTDKSGKYGVKAVCIECRDKQIKEWYESNREQCISKSKEWQEKNAERHKETRKNHKKNNIEIFRQRKNKYKSERRKTDPSYKLNHNISRGINDCLSGTKNRRHWEELVGYTKKQLAEHLESLFQSGMTWDNYGVYGWHVDYKRPIASFDFTTLDDSDFKQCWALENLQPLWWQDNIAKSDKWEATG